VCRVSRGQPGDRTGGGWCGRRGQEGGWPHPGASSSGRGGGSRIWPLPPPRLVHAAPPRRSSTPRRLRCSAAAASASTQREFALASSGSGPDGVEWAPSSRGAARVLPVPPPPPPSPARLELGGLPPRRGRRCGALRERGRGGELQGRAPPFRMRRRWAFPSLPHSPADGARAVRVGRRRRAARARRPVAACRLRVAAAPFSAGARMLGPALRGSGGGALGQRLRGASRGEEGLGQPLAVGRQIDGHNFFR